VSNIVNYFEIGTPDADATRSFYGELFDWAIG
jgi:predicted enzyme related to lactoylglutathione lyase